MKAWSREGLPDLRLRSRQLPVLLFIIAFWILEFLLLTAERMFAQTGDTTSMLGGRGITTCVGVFLSGLIWRVHQSQENRSLRFRILTAVALPVATSAIHSVINYSVFQLLLGERNAQSASVASYLEAVAFWYWCYVGISGLLLSLVYGSQLAQRERDLARVEQLAHTAQLRALRYQINPHFMFNTLNSIAALICTGDNVVAERMVENLGEFFRASLAVDPQDDHPLEQEVRLLSLYLDIETQRYPDRIAYRLEIQPPAERALVPSLILQPLTENVFRHAVGVSASLVDLELRAEVRGDVLVIKVSNSEPTGIKATARGTGVGLRNVEERLRARFGNAQTFKARSSPERGFEVELRIPAAFSGVP